MAPVTSEAPNRERRGVETLEGRSALVTGASKGLGRVIARALAARGMELALTARTRRGLEETAEEVRGRGSSAVVLPADLADRDGVRRLAGRAEERLGGVDVLVNNAGVLRAWPFHRREPEALARAIEVNLTAPILLIRHLLPGMLERGRGHVVNLASLAGKLGPPFAVPYGTTKAGLLGLTQSLRREYRGTGVSASAICPNYVRGVGMYEDAVERTGATAPRRAGRATPEGVARAVVRAIRKDAPEVIVNSVPTRPILALAELSPRLGEWLTRTMDLFRSFETGARTAVERQEAAGSGADADDAEDGAGGDRKAH